MGMSAYMCASTGVCVSIRHKNAHVHIHKSK